MICSSASRSRSTRRGMITAQVAMSLTVLMGVLAVVLDGGLLLTERRHAQATADAAALAAASDLYFNWYTNFGTDPGTAASSALSVANSNGYANDITRSVVTVNIPPASGNFKNKAGYAEVIVTWNEPRGFSGIFGSGDIPVSARAVAQGLVTGAPATILLLDPTASPALNVTGNATVTVNGSVAINSTAADSMSNTGNVTVTAGAFLLAAGAPGYTDTGNVTLKGTIQNSQAAMADPLSSLAAPSTSGLTTQSPSQMTFAGNGSVTLQPGVYIGGISITGNYAVTLSPGIYYLQGGGMSATGNVSLTGSGVTIYNAPNSVSDTINLTGNIVMNLSPPTSGTYDGVTIFQSRTSAAPVSITGNAGSDITGTIYAPDAPVKIVGNSNVEVGSQYISKTLNIVGNSSFNVGDTGSPVAGTRNLSLVE